MLIFFLTRGWVWRLQLLLVPASAVILRSESRGTHHHILLSQIRDSPNLEGQSPYLYLPGAGWPSLLPGTGFPFRHLLRLAGLRWRYSKPPTHEASDTKHQHKIEYISQVQHKPSARVKTNIKRLHTHEG
jgi:hypothetical protein